MIVRTFVELAKQGEPVTPDIWGARDSAASAIAATESAETGQPVKIPANTLFRESGAIR